MALELFKPFVMNRLVMKGYAHNIKSAKRMAERIRPEVWDILEEVVKDRPVLLNRAPTLHRLGIQAFEPVLIDGAAIQVHPLVCTAFNADFDGDQMAVHVPLSREAVTEARRLMLSTFNMLSPSSGEPIVAPTQDIVLGTYYMTIVDENAKGTGRRFNNFSDAHLAYDMEVIGLRALISVRHELLNGEVEVLETTMGRILFNDEMPKEIPFQNAEIEKGALKDIVALCYKTLGNERTAVVLDAIKVLGFRHATKSGVTIAINDVVVPPEKAAIVAGAEDKVATLEQQYMDGLITKEERDQNAVQVWTDTNETLTKVIEENLHNYGGIYLMANSGAKGNIAQIKQMAGMRGLMSDPKGRIIPRPIKSNFREGLSVLEYFISTHGARKGLADTALRTADSGYLTRRLIDVSQEVIITQDDCDTLSGIWVDSANEDDMATSFREQIRYRYMAAPVADPATGEILLDRNELIDDDVVDKLETARVEAVMVRSPMNCEAQKGICEKCYGTSLATMKPAMRGEAVGIIAAQSIGEPGTQLTMRTFHTGGIIGSDITSGLPRIEELFEARTPKGEAVLSEIAGEAEVIELPEGRSIRVVSTEEYSDEYVLPEGFASIVQDGDMVSIGERLAESEDSSEENEEVTALQSSDLIARVSGVVNMEGDVLNISWSDEEQREYVIPAAAHIIVRSGDPVIAGQALTSGPKNPQQILSIQGRDAVRRYLIDEVQTVYRSQGVPIHNKHVELIIRQMLRKVRIDDPGDTDLLPAELIDRRNYEETNESILAEGGEPATATPVLLGITRASLNMDSFLAAASFQETTRVLTEAAVNGDIDYLRGLKENVIIGRLIPARLDLSGEEIKGLAEGSLPRPLGIMSGGTQPRDHALLGEDPQAFGLGKNPDFVVEEKIVTDTFEQIPSSDD
jgi:DNA-directed RNA polymerase subunit beta'